MSSFEKVSPGIVNGLRQAFGAVARANSSGCDLEIPLSSEVERGMITQLMDLRGCYPHLMDPCPNLDSLGSQLHHQMAHEKRASGTVLLTPEYVIKSIPHKEVLSLRTALLKLYAATTSEMQVRKVQSMVSPICLMATVNDREVAETWKDSLKHNARRAKEAVWGVDSWIVMRRATLTQGDLSLLHLPEHPANFFDLKGQIPFGAAQSKLGFSWMKKKVWSSAATMDKFRDPGFQDRFPFGLEIVRTKECEASCMDFEQLLESDSAMLESVQATDYSVLIELYPSSKQDEVGDICGAKGRYPAIFKARDPNSKRFFVVSVGLIDYGSTDVANPALVLSTRHKPGKYRKNFQNLWGDMKKKAYFHCHHHQG